MKSMTREEIMRHFVDELDLQVYGLREGFDHFERRCVECLDEINREPFEWRLNNKQDVTVYITIESRSHLDPDGELINVEFDYYVDSVKTN